MEVKSTWSGLYTCYILVYLKNKISPGQSTLHTGAYDDFTSVVRYTYIRTIQPYRVELLHRHLALSQLQNLFVDAVDALTHVSILHFRLIDAQ